MVHDWAPLTESSGLCDRQPQQSIQLIERKPPGKQTCLVTARQGAAATRAWPSRLPSGFCLFHAQSSASHPPSDTN